MQCLFEIAGGGLGLDDKTLCYDPARPKQRDNDTNIGPRSIGGFRHPWL